MKPGMTHQPPVSLLHVLMLTKRYHCADHNLVYTQGLMNTSLADYVLQFEALESNEIAEVPATIIF